MVRLSFAPDRPDSHDDNIIFIIIMLFWLSHDEGGLLRRNGSTSTPPWPCCRFCLPSSFPRSSLRPLPHLPLIYNTNFIFVILGAWFARSLGSLAHKYYSPPLVALALFVPCSHTSFLLRPLHANITLLQHGMSLDVKKKFSVRSDRVKSVDLHPTEPWLLTALYNGQLIIYNFQTEQVVRQWEVSSLPRT